MEEEKPGFVGQQAFYSAWTVRGDSSLMLNPFIMTLGPFGPFEPVSVDELYEAAQEVEIRKALLCVKSVEEQLANVDMHELSVDSVVHKYHETREYFKDFLGEERYSYAVQAGERVSQDEGLIWVKLPSGLLVSTLVFRASPLDCLEPD